jgi:hypothetical protein
MVLKHKAGTIMLTHELNNFTMQEAMDFHDQLQAAFQVQILLCQIP